MELLRLYSVLARRKWLVYESLLFFVLASLVLSLVLPKRYAASARVLVGSSETSASLLSDLGLGEMAASMTARSDETPSRIALSTTRPVLEAVIWKLQLRDEEGVLRNPDDMAGLGLLTRLTDDPAVQVTEQQGTNLLVFEAEASDPETARLLADAMVHVAVEHAEDQAQAESRHAREFVEGQLALVKTEFDKALQQIADVENAQDVIDLESEMKAAIARLSTLMLSFEENAAAMQDLRARVIEAKAYVARGRVADPSVYALESELAGRKLKGEEIQASIDKTTALFSTYPDKLRDLTQLELAADAAQNVYKALSEQRYEIAVAEQMTLSDLQLVEPATTPERPASPKLLVNLLVGLGLGGLVGIGLAFFVDYIDDSVKSPEELRDVWAIPRLGIIPDVPPDTLSAGADPWAEAYRTVRNGIAHASIERPLCTIAVTSAMPGEGKTSVARNLALSFAREGKTVVLVDADLRRPALHQFFPGAPDDKGLSTVLAGDCLLAEAVRSTTFEGLAFLASGPIPEEPARLIESLRLRAVLKDLRNSYDVVVLDTPPLLVVNDAMIVARAVDGMVVVVEALRTKKALLAEVRLRFESAALTPIGLVLNRLPLSTLGYGDYLRAYEAYRALRPTEGTADRNGGVA